MQLRPYQQNLINDIYEQWQSGHKNVCAVMPTGAGKTVTFSAMNTDGRPSCTIVHRQELVGQISKTYAMTGIVHNVIAPQPVINFCIQQHIDAVGRSFYDPQSPASVAGVDTLPRRFNAGERWPNSIQRWTGDECHHFLQSNKWGKAVDLFPNAYGLGVTATPIRADNKSLHFDQGGLFHSLVQGPGMRDLIEMGNLCDYRVIAPKPSINEDDLDIGSTGEFTEKSKKRAVEKSKITGDVVDTYCQHVPGKQAIVFAVDIEQSEKIAERFNAAGVKAAALSSKTNDSIRAEMVKRFAQGTIQVLVNVDLFGEGFDVPAVEVVIMARPTMSFGLFVQMFGRCLRTAPGKQYGIIIDHVGNVMRMAATHGMPDTPRQWKLWIDRADKNSKRNPDAVPVRTCESCMLTYERTQMQCPYCGHLYEPEGRDLPAQVDGILEEMSPELLQQLRMAKAEIWSDFVPVPHGASDAIAGKKHKDHARRQMAQSQLIEAMEFWGGVQLAEGRTDAQMQARFLHRFGVDVLTAQTLKAADAIKLTEQIRLSLT